MFVMTFIETHCSAVQYSVEHLPFAGRVQFKGIDIEAHFLYVSHTVAVELSILRPQKCFISYCSDVGMLYRTLEKNLISLMRT